jgi:hypothetical protein
VPRKQEPSSELLELMAVVQDLSSFVMGMDAKLDLIIELVGGEDEEEENRADF